MNFRISDFLALALLVAALALPTQALALKGVMTTTVLSVLVTSEPLPPPANTGLYYGGCMASLAKPIASATPSPNCPGIWVSFSCDGTYASKDTASLMFDQAQLAWATKRPVYVQVDDTKLHNGYCIARRLDLN